MTRNQIIALMAAQIYAGVPWPVPSTPSNCVAIAHQLATLAGLEEETEPSEPKERWYPNDGQRYWFIREYGMVESATRSGSTMPFFFLGVYPTKAEAEAALAKIKKLLSE